MKEETKDSLMQKESGTSLVPFGFVDLAQPQPMLRWRCQVRDSFPATALALCLFIAAEARSQTGQPDPAFDVGPGPNGTVLAILPLTNRTILVGGEFSQWN